MDSSIVLNDMLLFAAMYLGVQRTPADEVMRSIVDHYHKLKSLSAKVIHHGDFQASVKDSSDTLQWLAPKRFEIACDKVSVPKLVCDGKRLTTVVPDLPPISEAFEPDNQKVAAWEYRGGFLFSLLMRSPFADEFLKPPKPVKVSYAYGKTLKWHDVPVSEIQATLVNGKSSVMVSYYLSPDYHALVGTEIVTGVDTIWTQYADIVENPALPKTLGSVAH